jgi:hypothetical protein
MNIFFFLSKTKIFGVKSIKGGPNKLIGTINGALKLTYLLVKALEIKCHVSYVRTFDQDFTYIYSWCVLNVGVAHPHPQLWAAPFPQL